MKTTEEVLKETDSIYLWKDKATLDLTVKDDSKTFPEELIELKCKRCEADLIDPSSNTLKQIQGSVLGMHLTCPTSTCKQKWYVHKPITIPTKLEG